jgi:plasmid maintenance system antidote protein VapI
LPPTANANSRFSPLETPAGRKPLTATRIGEIVNGKRAITPDTALRLAHFFGNSPKFWLNLQQMHDLFKARIELKKTIEREVEVFNAA